MDRVATIMSIIASAVAVAANAYLVRQARKGRRRKGGRHRK